MSGLLVGATHRRCTCPDCQSRPHTLHSPERGCRCRRRRRVVGACTPLKQRSSRKAGLGYAGQRAGGWMMPGSRSIAASHQDAVPGGAIRRVGTARPSRSRVSCGPLKQHASFGRSRWRVSPGSGAGARAALRRVPLCLEFDRSRSPLPSRMHRCCAPPWTQRAVPAPQAQQWACVGCSGGRLTGREPLRADPGARVRG